MRLLPALILLLLPQPGWAADAGGKPPQEKSQEEPKDFQQTIREFEAEAQKENPEKVAQARARAAAERDVEEKANTEAIGAMMRVGPAATDAQDKLDTIQKDLKQGQWERCKDGSGAACAAYEGRLFGNPSMPAGREGEGVRPPEPRL